MSDHIVFESADQVFTLTAGRSMYAMRISENGGLEHLYWGPALPNGTDLRYITRSNVAQPFDPTTRKSEARPASLPTATHPVAEALAGGSLETWKSHRGAADGEQAMKASHTGSETKDSIYERRLENISWRLMAMGKDEQVSSEALAAAGSSFEPLEAAAPRPRSRRSSKEGMAAAPGIAPPEGSEGFPRISSVEHLDLTMTDAQLARAREGPIARPASSAVNTVTSTLGAGGSLGGAKRGSFDHLGSSRSASHDTSHLGSSAHLAALIEEELSPVATNQPTMATGERIGKNMGLLEVSDMGTGDYRQPSFVVEYSDDGSTISPLVYRSHEIVTGKAPMPAPMPHVRARAAPPPPPGAPPTSPPDAADGPIAATTLIVTLVDVHTGLLVDAHFTAMHDLEVIVRRLRVRNATTQVVRLRRCMSATLDFDVPLHNYWMTQLDGSWARERHVCHRQLQQGLSAFGSQRGTSSHQHSPFVAISEGHAPPEEDHGHVYGFALVYSGNFLAEAEVVDVGRLRVNMGVQPSGFTWHLAPGDDFSTPECACVFSAAGLGRMSRQFHSLVREHIIPPTWRHVPCPVLCNTWEAEYFNVSHDSVVAMARAARAVGVEMIVLDDGWFGERHDATSSLGDWAPNAGKFPFGIRGLAHEVNAEGMAFGLWIEPEMVSTNSKLYEAHPDWCLQVPGRTRHEGRNQLVLDMSRVEVREHVFESIAVTLRSANVVYVKWDMNRHLTEAFSVALPPHRQGEILHRYTLGVYDLHDRFVSAFPNVRFEACSGGGGRFDLGILYYCPQVWASDNTDALMRMKIQHGTSYVFPAMTAGSHYSVVPNHITQGYARKRTRALVAMCGTFGYELDLRRCGDDADAICRQVSAHKLVHPIVRDGDLFRLWDPFRVNYCAWAYVLREKLPSGRTVATKAAVFAFNRSSTFWSNLLPRLQLRGLEPSALYEVREPLPNNRMQKSGTLEVVRTPGPVHQLGAECVRMHGATLMNVGIPLRFLSADDSLLFLLQRVEE